MNVLNPSVDDLMSIQLDITQPGMPVEMKVDDRGVIWVNVGPVCVLRICRNEGISVNVNGEDVHRWTK